jgi:hypothetical protein
MVHITIIYIYITYIYIFNILMVKRNNEIEMRKIIFILHFNKFVVIVLSKISYNISGKN